MPKLNLNKLATRIVCEENDEIPISQAKEVIRLTIEELKKEWEDGNEIVLLTILTSK